MTQLWRTMAWAGLLVLVGTVAAAQYGIEEWLKAGSNPEHYRMGPDEAVQRDGEPTVTLQSLPAADEELAGCPRCFGTYMRARSAEAYRGKKVRLSAFVRSARVQRQAGLWLRVDGPDGRMLAFDNMQGRPIKGDTDWTQHHIVLDVPDGALELHYGILLSQSGAVWMDDLQIDVVTTDVPVTDQWPASPRGPRNLGFEER